MYFNFFHLTVILLFYLIYIYTSSLLPYSSFITIYSSHLSHSPFPPSLSHVFVCIFKAVCKTHVKDYHMSLCLSPSYGMSISTTLIYYTQGREYLPEYYVKYEANYTFTQSTTTLHIIYARRKGRKILSKNYMKYEMHV